MSGPAVPERERRDRATSPESRPAFPLRLRVAALVLGVTSILCGAGLAIVGEGRDLLRDEMERRGWALATYLERFAGDRIPWDGREGLEPLVRKIVEADPDLAAVTVLDVRGDETVVESGSRTVGEDPIVVAREIRSGATRERLGGVKAVFSTDRIEERLRVVRGAVLAASLGLAALLAVLLLGGLQQVVLGPIRELARYAASIGRGEGAPPLRRARRAEFGLLAGALQSASEAVQSRDRALHDRFDAIRSAYLQLESVLQTLDEGVLVADGEGRVVLTNRTLARILGPADALLRRPLLDVLPGPAVEGTEAAGEAALPEEGEGPNEWTAVLGRHTYRVGVTRISGGSGGAIRYLAVLRDFTRESEDAAMKNEFIACVSHELRTPLTSILSFTEMLLTMGTQDEDELREFLEIVHREASRMSRLVDDILDIARIEGGTFPLRIGPVDPGEVVREVEKAFLAVARDSGIDLSEDVAPGVPVLAIDRERLAQVLTNLVSNAIKFTPIGGRVRIRVRRETVRDEDGDRTGVAFDVQDSGPGIPAAERERIFEKFAQLGDPLVDKPRGTGLGLPISRGIVSRMGGTIRVESTLGKGSVFSVWIPLAAPSPDEVRPPTADRKTPRPLRAGA